MTYYDYSDFDYENDDPCNNPYEESDEGQYLDFPYHIVSHPDEGE